MRHYDMLDAAAHTLSLSVAPGVVQNEMWTFAQEQPGSLRLTSTMHSSTFVAVLKKADKSAFLLTGRGFNWVVEEEWFNR